MNSVQWFMLVALSLLFTAGITRADEMAACIPDAPSPQRQASQLLPQAKEIRGKFMGGSSLSGPGGKGRARGQGPGGAAPMSDEKRESWERLVLMRVKNSACADADMPDRKGGDEDNSRDSDSDDKPGKGDRPQMGGAGGPHAGSAELKGVPQELAGDPDFLIDIQEAKDNREHQCTKKRIEEAKDEQIAAIRSRKCEMPTDSAAGGAGAGPDGGDRGAPRDRDSSDRDDDRDSKGKGFGGVHLDASARREVDEATDKWEEKCKAERAQNQKNTPGRNVAGAGNMGGQGMVGGQMMRPQTANYMAGYSAPYLFVGGSQQSSSIYSPAYSAGSSFAGYPFSSGYYGYNQGISSVPFAQTSLLFLSGQSGLGFRSLWGGNSYGTSSTSNRTF